MKRALLIAMLGALSIHTFVEAQQGGVNTSVLPPRFNPPPATITPDEFVRTDAIGQKQMEGAIAASTRAWDVLFAVFNDYRWVQAGDFLTGETTNGGGIMSNLLAWLFHRPRKPAVRPVSAAAPAEAWIGGATSNDGGATWSGVFVPGGPFDNSPPSLASPVKALNFESGTDPWIVSAPCGFFHVVWVPFTRFQDSAVAVATYQHMNDADGRRTIRYRYSSIVQYVHNAANGPFLDLPNMAIQPDQSSSDPCKYNLYVTYMAFNGVDQSTKPSFARSSDGGQTWQKTSVSTQPKTNQRAVLAVDPRDGAIYLAFRSFSNGAPSDNAMWITRSIDGGKSFDKPVLMNGTPLQPFDQPTQSVDTCGALAAPDCVAFRSNAYLSLRVIPDQNLANPSTLLAAWVERVSVLGCAAVPSPIPPCGEPDGLGQEPKVVLMKASTVNYAAWSDLAGNLGKRKAIDFGDRDTTSAPAPGQGYLPQPRGSGAQFQPHIVSGGGDVGIVYFEGRGPLTGSPGFLAGLHRHVDARFALLDPVTFALRGTSQISKYPISAAADLSNGEDQSDIAEVSAGTGVRAVNDKGNGPNSGAGKIPFIGDYTAAIATVDWVLEDGRWRSAYKKGDLPYPGFRAVFADSRNLIPPPGTDAQQIAAYPNFTPVGLPNCANPGTRNHDVEHVLVNASVILDVPTTFKFLGVIQRAFPFSLINGQAFEQFFRIDLVPDDGVQASFSQGTSATTLTDIQTRMFVDLIRYSSTTRVIYMASQIPTGSTRIDVYQVSAIGDTGGTLVGSSRLNLDPTNTSTLSATSETHTVSVSPLVTSPLVTSPLVTSTGAGSTMVANPLVTSPLVTSPLVTSSAYQDFTWTVSGGSDMVNSAMVAQVFVDKANSQQTSKSYKFELRIHKRAAHLGINGCTSGPAADEQLISSIFIDTAAVNTDDPTATPLVTSPLVTSPLVTSPLVTSPLVTSSTFSMSPPDTTSTSGGTTASVTAEAAATSDDGTLQDKLDNRVFITLRAYLNKSIDPTKAPKLATPNIRVEPLSRDVIPDPNNPGQFILR